MRPLNERRPSAPGGQRSVQFDPSVRFEREPGEASLFGPDLAMNTVLTPHRERL